MLFTHMLDGFALHEMIFDAEGKAVDYRFLEVNPAFEQITDFPRLRSSAGRSSKYCQARKPTGLITIARWH